MADKRVGPRERASRIMWGACAIVVNICLIPKWLWVDRSIARRDAARRRKP